MDVNLASSEFTSLPFDQAIDFFRDKVELPTETWKDLWKGQHSRAFVVAGATKNALLADLRGAVDKALAEGTTLAEFQKDFDEIVARHGWDFKGPAAWRAKVIYDTNLSTAYAAGHYKQMTSGAVLKLRPFWRYVPSSSVSPNPAHVPWYNVVLPADDPWWQSHYPPNDWGCKCGVVNMSARELERLEREEVDGDFPIQRTAPDEGTYEWTDKATGEVHDLPRGIGPGWDYNPGEAAWGRQLSDKTMNAWRAQGGNAWERLTPGDYTTAGRPKRIPVDKPKASLGKTLDSSAAAAKALRKLFGGEEKVFSFTRDGFRYDVLANAETLATHIPADRTPFLPFIAEALEDPFEVWLSFEQHKGTGRMALRQRMVKLVDTGKGKDRGLLIVAQAVDGIMEAWTAMPVRDLGYLQRQRVGKLVWGR